MTKKNKIFSGKHVVWTCRYHLVFVTKYRKKIISIDSWREMFDSFRRVLESFDGDVIEANWESDHVHLLISLPPKYSISKLVNSLKGVSSRKAKLGNLWSPSYYVGTCGEASLETVKKYILSQRNSSSA